MTTTAVISSACALVLLVAAVTSSPVLPEVGLKDMQADHACLFMCEMCFSGHMKDMLYCANNVCIPAVCNAPGLVWLGKACKNPALLDKYLAK